MLFFSKNLNHCFVQTNVVNSWAFSDIASASKINFNSRKDSGITNGKTNDLAEVELRDVLWWKRKQYAGNKGDCVLRVEELTEGAWYTECASYHL